MQNAKYLAYFAHQTQKWTLIRYAKCAKNIKHATVCSHFLERTNPNAISIYCLFIHLSLSSLITLFIFFLSPLSYFLRHSYQPISSFTLFSSHFCGFSLFCSASPISVAVGFFFGSDLMGGFDSGWLLSFVQPRRAT